VEERKKKIVIYSMIYLFLGLIAIDVLLTVKAFNEYKESPQGKCALYCDEINARYSYVDNRCLCLNRTTSSLVGLLLPLELNLSSP
jgi:hypothetical protein